MVKTAVVTGANRGIGLAVARALGASGLEVVLLCRDRHQGERARELVSASGGRARLVVGSLSTIAAVREAGWALGEACERVDVLVHNAGIWPSGLERDEQGLERAFVVNHLAPFALNLLLEPRLIASRARVVQVSAGLHAAGHPSLHETPWGRDFSPLRTYATTKLCNLSLVPVFAERWREAGVSINAVHPGVIRTDLGDRPGLGGAVLRGMKRLWKSPEEGARPVVRLALDPSLEGVSGRYFDLEREALPSPLARDRALAASIWKQAMTLCSIDVPLPAGLAGRRS